MGRAAPADDQHAQPLEGLGVAGVARLGIGADLELGCEVEDAAFAWFTFYPDLPVHLLH